MNYSKLPIVGKLYSRLKNKINEQEDAINYVCEENIKLRFKLKALNHEKINVVFVCWRPAVWGSLKTIYEAMKDDDEFNVKIVTIPNKKQLPKLGLSHEVYESEGAEEFWKGDDVISGYDYETGEWLDLRLLKADYVCFQQPYNVCRTGAEKSWVVRKYARLFYVAYGYNSVKKLAIECWPKDFTDDISLYFAQSQTEYNWYTEYASLSSKNHSKTYLTGFPRFDNLEKYKDCKCSLWKLNNNTSLKILWTPRWCTNENNCHFFAYKNDLIKMIKNDEQYDFIFRPHPQSFLNWESTGEFSLNSREDMLKSFEESKNMYIDYSKDYLPLFYSSDVLITDYSSIIPEYFLTEKPIIYCKNEKSLYDPEGKFAEGFYYVNNWNELKNTLEMIKNGNDPLKEKRLELIKSEFNIDKIGSGYKIKEIIKEDFYNS